MDLKDRKILYELDKNARASFTQIGKAVKMSPESVRYRISNLVKEGTIKYFLTVIDSAKLGASYYDIFLKLQNVDAKGKAEIISFFMNSKHITWMADLDGAFDVAMIIKVKNQLELQHFIDQMNTKFNSAIMKKTISVNLKGEFYRRDYLVNKKRSEALPEKNTRMRLEYSPEPKNMHLEDIDEKLCSTLSNNSRMNSVEVGKRLGVSADTAMLHMKKLHEEGIISGYTIVVDNEKLSQLHYKILLYTSNNIPAKTSQLLTHIRMNNRVIAIIHTLAEWDYEIDIEVENVKQLKDFTMQLTNEFSQIIKDYSVLRIVDMPKYNFFP